MRTTAHLTRRAASAKRPIKGNQIVRRCCAGAVLCKSHGRAGVSYTLQPPGTKVKTRYARAAIMSGALVPMRDGLFGHVQTWVFATSPIAPTPPARARAARARTALTGSQKQGA